MRPVTVAFQRCIGRSRARRMRQQLFMGAIRNFNLISAAHSNVIVLAPPPAKLYLPIYSYRKAIIGSTDEARRAGAQLESSATTPTPSAADAKVSPSAGLTP